MEVQTQQDLDIQELTKKIKELLNSQLHHKCNKREVLPLSEDPSYGMSDEILWSLFERQRLARALSLAKARLRLLLTMLGLLNEQLFKNYDQLSTFMQKHRWGLSSRDEAAAAKQTAEQTLQYAADFDNQVLRSQGPLGMRVKLIPNVGYRPFPWFTMSLLVKLPVVIDRSTTSVTSSSVHLFWSISETGDQNSNEQFEVQVKSLHPTIGEDKFSRYTTQLHLDVENLAPGRCYQLSVKRVDAVNLMYGQWVDALVVKTLQALGSKATF
ncbi:fibronectin type III domain-containing protein 11-like [Halichoeres trimaculatus]|uniref:fibronectin type III domain-containing protein 11-like n=1 Tax=Halichoeres trimaculatus TaxID=147232 RepID=UPI003D9F5BE0